MPTLGHAGKQAEMRGPLLQVQARYCVIPGLLKAQLGPGVGTGVQSVCEDCVSLGEAAALGQGLCGSGPSRWDEAQEEDQS